ncbi:hypothetical protein [Nannocystis pusilla]|uniref:hypothetical protein n=1 Tax=Nannocystis pusilla TaxID=889268 RepID=UPI003DA2C340
MVDIVGAAPGDVGLCVGPKTTLRAQRFRVERRRLRIPDRQCGTWACYRRRMALRSREQSTPMLGLMLAASLLVTLVLGGLAAAERDGVFGILAAVAAIGAAALARLRLRLAERRGPEPLEPDAGTAAPARRAFVTDASQSIGPRARDGIVVIGRDLAAFIPTSQWRQLGVELVIGLFFQRVRLSRIDIDARDTPALAGELAELVRQRDGFLLDERWSQAFGGRALWRAESEECVRLTARPPAEALARWPALAAPPPAELRRMFIKVLAIGGAAAGLIAAAGVVAWRLSSDSDYLIAGIAYAVIVGGSAVGGAVLARRMLATNR